MTPPQRLVDSPLGPIRIRADERGRISEVRIGAEAQKLGAGVHTDAGVAARRVLDDAAAQLGEYFEGRRTSFDIAVALEGSPFQLQVWAQLQAISFGTTVSYGQIAMRLDRPGAARAVGHANARNPIPIIVPCHRVIGSTGGLTGYGGGLEAKRVLLDLEARGTTRAD